MKRLLKIALFAVLCLVIVQWTLLLLKGSDFVVLSPKGLIAAKQRDLIFTSIFLMCLVVVPAIVMTLLFAWKFRESNKQAKYTPEWSHSFLAESIWWGVPLLIIIILSIITWRSSHELDPFKPIEPQRPSMKIQAIALQWKWLFLYPEEKIATVNYVQFPEKTPLLFEITADAPMNSFWIPQLGGQIYAMAGMKTQLNLIANESGTFRGSSANLSGKGFAGMTFVAKATTEEEFSRWVSSVREESHSLTQAIYEQDLAPPSEYHPVQTYVLSDEHLFDHIVMKSMEAQ